MGGKKRKRAQEYENIRKKVKKLEKKLRKCRNSTSSSSHNGDGGSSVDQEPQHYSEYDPEENIPSQSGDDFPDEVLPSPEEKVEKEPPEDLLDPQILSILGEDPSIQKEYGDDLQKDIANRWAHILVNGMSKELKSDLMKEYLPAKNCINMKAPKLNLEVEAALAPINVKKDLFSQTKQNQISSCLAAIGKVLNSAISSKDATVPVEMIVKPLSDAGRLLSDCHYRESQSRRYAIVNNLNKLTRDAVKNTKIDEYLFGTSLAEHLKSSKAISKSGSEMRRVVQRSSYKPPPPRAAVQNQRGALNYRGRSRAMPSEPRRNPAPRRQAPAARDHRQDNNSRGNTYSRRGARIH